MATPKKKGKLKVKTRLRKKGEAKRDTIAKEAISRDSLPKAMTKIPDNAATIKIKIKRKR